MNTYKAGNTVRFSCEFRDFADTLADPSLIKFKIYNQKYEIVQEVSVSSSANKQSTGKYFYDYTIPTQYANQKLIYEWYGEVGGNPSLDRNTFKVMFV
jgi:hypothetical protein